MPISNIFKAYLALLALSVSQVSAVPVALPTEDLVARAPMPDASLSARLVLKREADPSPEELVKRQNAHCPGGANCRLPPWMGGK
jgi:hypothetical protein